MIWIGYIVIVFLVLLFSVSLANLISKPVLSPIQPVTAPLVSILIPARNEAKNIATLLQTIINQKYQDIEIIVCDDQSEDETVTIVSDMIKTDKRIRIIHTAALPDGWLGKNHACYLLANEAKGEYLCFLDADVSLQPKFINSVIAYMQHRSLSLLSLFPEQKMLSVGEKLTVPIMFRVLLSLLPLRLVQTRLFASLQSLLCLYYCSINTICPWYLFSSFYFVILVLIQLIQRLNI